MAGPNGGPAITSTVTRYAFWLRLLVIAAILARLGLVSSD